MATDTRVQFEAWPKLKDEGFNLSREADGDYVAFDTSELWAAWQARDAPALPADPKPQVDHERLAQLIAHRGCCSSEHDPANGKIHGYCVVCGVPWPCDYAGMPPTADPPALAAEILAEVTRATDKFPTWPTDPLHALAVLGEEFGELTKDVLQSVYEPHKTTRENVRKEAIQTAAMALRFAASLDLYDYRPGTQHSQCRAHAAALGVNRANR